MLGTKIHAMVTPESLPVTVAIGSAREHEGRRLIPLMESIGIRTGGGGRPRKRPRTLYADTKYNMPLNRFYLEGKGIRSQMPESPGKGKRPGRPRAFDERVYHRVRSSVERFNAWIKAFRRVAVRYERLPQVYMAFVHLASIVICLRIMQ
jgi:transposase